MNLIVVLALVVSALVHAMPVIGVLGQNRLQALYGYSETDPSSLLLLQHRAVLFGVLAGLCVAAAFTPSMRLATLVAALVSTSSYVALWALSGDRGNAPLARVAYIDIGLIVLLGTALAAWVVDRSHTGAR